MLMQPTLEQLYGMRLNGMADAFRRQLEDPAASELAFEERFALLVESQWTWKESRALTRRLALAKLKQQACLEDIDFRHPRGLERARWMSLAHESAWLRRKQNVVLVGPSGIGSQAAIPLAKSTAGRVQNLYDLLDSAYDAEAIRACSRQLGHVPLIDSNPRRDARKKAQLQRAALAQRSIGQLMPPARRYHERSTVERVNGRLKDECGGRHVRVRGHAKVLCHLMFGVVALTVDQLMRLTL